MSQVFRFSPYDATEQALLDRYFKRGRDDVSEGDPLWARTVELAGQEISTDCGERLLDVAAAKLILRNHEESLPNWTAFDRENRFVSGRKEPPPAKRNYRLPSQLLFGINWATSGPGFDWPEDFRITWLPSPGRYVVTGSLDSEDAYGFSDIALGHFAPSSRIDLITRVRGILVRRWQALRRINSQPPWECVLTEGLVKSQQAEEWRLLAWSAGEVADRFR